MYNFFRLLKIDIYNTWGLQKLKAKLKRKGTVLYIILVTLLALGACAVLGYIGFIFWTQGQFFVVGGYPDTLLYMAFTMASLFGLLTSTIRAKMILFKTRDFDFLMSMPVTPTQVVASKLFTLYFALLLNYVVLFLPAVVVYGIFVRPAWYLYVLFAGVPLFAAGLMLAICAFTSYILTLITAKLKFKNVVEVLSYVGLFVAIFFFNFRMGKTGGLQGASQEAIAQYTLASRTRYLRLFYPGYLAINGGLGNILSYGLFIAGALLLAGLTVLLVGRSFVAVNTNLKSQRKQRKSNKPLKFKQRSPLASLIVKDFKFYSQQPFVFINSAGASMIGTVLVAIMLPLVLNPVLKAGQLELGMYYLIMSQVLIFIGCLNVYTATAINVEGRYFWILRSAPLSMRKYIGSKLLFSQLLSAPFLIAAATYLTLMSPVKHTGYILLLYFGPLFTNMTFAMMGLLLNIFLPTLNAKSAYQAIKRSKSAIIIVLISLAFVNIIALLLYFTSPLYAGLFILVLGITITTLLWTIGVKRLEQLAC